MLHSLKSLKLVPAIKWDVMCSFEVSYFLDIQGPQGFEGEKGNVGDQGHAGRSGPPGDKVSVYIHTLCDVCVRGHPSFHPVFGSDS